MQTEAGRPSAADARALPSGTLTFLFADIEGSTRLVRELGEDYRAPLETYQAIFRRRIAEHSGYEIGTEGDSFFVVFERAADAIRCAVDAQTDMREAEWPHGRPMRVRIGIHSGAATERNGNYVGVAVHEAARVSGATNGGQTLVSVAANALSTSTLPADIVFNDVGAHRLKDIESPLRLYEVIAPGIEPGPAPNSLNDNVGTLPSQLTPFTGRRTELDEVSKMLEDERTRLVTLTGTGGTGKTRLAIEAASAARSSFRDGTWFVPLAPISSPDMVPSAVAQAIGAAEREGRTAATAVLEELATKRALVVLDNFEHVLGASVFVAQLLGTCPDCTVLVTSREPLKVSAERLYPVPPMSLPSSSEPLESISHNDAIALFVDRAKARDPSFALDAANAELITEICRRLDGLPLAIELAAARASAVGLQELLDQLRGGLGALGGGPDDAPDRHRTLDAAIAWSYDVLPERLQAIFRAASVFHGGFDAEAALEVCAATRDDLAVLVDRSLMRRAATSVAGRYEMLETIRAFAAMKLEGSSERERVEAAHAKHFKDVAVHAKDRFHTVDAAAWLDRLTLDHDNLRAAVDHHDRTDSTADLAVMTSALMEFWSIRGHIAEGTQRLERAVERSTDASQARAGAIIALARFKRPGGDSRCLKEHVPLIEEAWTIAEAVGDDRTKAWALVLLAPHSAGAGSSFASGLAKGYFDQPTEHPQPTKRKKDDKERKANPSEFFERALVLAESAGDDVLIAEIKASPWMAKGLGFFRASSGASRIVQASVEEAVARGDNRTAASLLLRPAMTARLDEKERLAERALELSREIGDQRLTSQALKRLGEYALQRYDHVRARDHFHESLEMARAVGDAESERQILGELLNLAAATGDVESLRAITGRLRTEGVEGRLQSLLGSLHIWNVRSRGTRAIAAGSAWAIAFVALHGTLRSMVLIASGLLLAGRLRDMRSRITRRTKKPTRAIPVVLFIAITFGAAVFFENLRIGVVGLSLLLLGRGWTLRRDIGFMSAFFGLSAIVVSATGAAEGAGAGITFMHLAVLAVVATPVVAGSRIWLVFRVGEVFARAGAALVVLDAIAVWRTGGRFNLGGWFDVAFFAAVSGLVVASVTLAADRRLAPAAVVLAAVSAGLPSALRADDPLSLAVGAAFGLVWLLIGVLQATAPWPEVPDLYPAHLRG